MSNLVFEPEILQPVLSSESTITAQDVEEIASRWASNPPDPEYEKILDAEPVEE